MGNNGNVDAVEALLALRMVAESEAETTAHRIETDLGSALLDVCAALRLGEEATRQIVGSATWEAYHDGDAPLIERVREVYAGSTNVEIAGVCR